MIVAFDTSALLKLIWEEPESASLEAFVGERAEVGDVLTLSALAVTEMRRACLRVGSDTAAVATLTSGFVTTRLDDGILQHAGRLPDPHLGTLDALHLATALRVEAQEFVTYDGRQAEAARGEGLIVRSPGTAGERR